MKMSMGISGEELVIKCGDNLYTLLGERLPENRETVDLEIRGEYDPERGFHGSLFNLLADSFVYVAGGHQQKFFLKLGNTVFTAYGAFEPEEEPVYSVESAPDQTSFNVISAWLDNRFRVELDSYFACIDLDEPPIVWSIGRSRNEAIKNATENLRFSGKPSWKEYSLESDNREVYPVTKQFYETVDLWGGSGLRWSVSGGFLDRAYLAG